ncbi:HPr kinase/phosphorylase [Peteryoungia desertarenae]|uniref:HPr kinase/phosphorylase n=1 Tax=Peteryoungia desertarenae TaxID=1813451 RepID=A0ABX6QK00_9HYPH|nr:HPr kinase/phosphorylase [Peteryoungia desertarenae]QLF68886.1 HPr kinase/phosphorylase [Peteryoungia desertarenae]
MNGGFVNIHGTAITIDDRGLLFIGPSGAGKSDMAFSCITEARMCGRAAALVADDQVFVGRNSKDEILARAPQTTVGLIELRFSGIVRVPSQAEAILQLAIMPVDPDFAERLPARDEKVVLAGDLQLPLFRIPRGWSYPLARIDALLNRI